MSAAEIADNKWELAATKPPLKTVPGIAQIVLMSGFSVFFLWILGFSIMGIVMPKAADGGLAGQYKDMNNQPAAPAE